MPTVRVGDIKIYHEIHGNGEPLLMIPGLTVGAGVFFRVTPLLAKKFRVIAMDNRGVGQSDKPDIPYSTEMMADDAVGLLLALGIQQAHVLGSSMGGMIAQHMALRHPQSVATLTLLSTSCGGNHSVPVGQEVSSALLSGQTPEDRIRALLPYTFTQTFIAGHPEVIVRFTSVCTKDYPPPHAFARQAGAAIMHDTYEQLPRMKVPTLVISGAEDEVMPVENSRILASRMPDAQLMIMDGLRHGLCTEAPEEIGRVVHSFLRQHPIEQGT
jgi:pimeloyl-ACP methyl ester carboxylesterase